MRELRPHITRHKSLMREFNQTPDPKSRFLNRFLCYRTIRMVSNLNGKSKNTLMVHILVTLLHLDTYDFYMYIICQSKFDVIILTKYIIPVKFRFLQIHVMHKKKTPRRKRLP